MKGSLECRDGHDNEKPRDNFEYSREDGKLEEIKVESPAVSRLLAFRREAIFLSNFDFNLKLCTKCGCEVFIEDMFCYSCGNDLVNVKKAIPNEPAVSRILTFRREAIFLANFDFNLKKCPECGCKLLGDDAFCYSCGEKLTDGPSRKESEIAYVLYLDAIRKNPKKAPLRIERKYGVDISELENRALDDAFIELESPLDAARRLKVSDLKEILRKNSLKVSGKKEELIERLGENFSGDELNAYFKPQFYIITERGIDFLKNNLNL